MNKYTIVAVGLLGGFLYPRFAKCIKTLDSYFFSEKKRNELLNKKLEELDRKFKVINDKIEERMNSAQAEILMKIAGRCRDDIPEQNEVILHDDDLDGSFPDLCDQAPKYMTEVQFSERQEDVEPHNDSNEKFKGPCDLTAEDMKFQLSEEVPNK